MEGSSLNYNNSKIKKAKLAILILAHKNLNQLKRLISKLCHEEVDVFIHLDKKWKLKTTQIEDLEHINIGKVFISDNRISGKLFDWSLIEAEMENIKKAKLIEKEKEIHYKYYLLLSGQDYPIKSIDYIITFLSKQYPKPFIDCTSYNSKRFLKRKFMTIPIENKVLRYFLKTYKPTKIIKTFHRIFKILFYSLFLFIKLFKSVPFTQLEKLDCKLYTGSQWWILPDMAINEIHKSYYNSDDKIVKILRKTFGPDESFFQIMVMRTSISHLVELNEIHRTQNCLTYAHFYDEGKPFTGHPYVLVNHDFDKIKLLPHFFARKFDVAVDADILNRIDNEILYNTTTPVQL